MDGHFALPDCDTELDDKIIHESLWDESEERLIAVRKQNVTPILDANKRQANDFRYDKKATFHHVASIPNIVIEQMLLQGINPYSRADWDKVKNFLNENPYLKTTPWRL